MRYTKSALGFLNAQYRSVLKKCFLINLGLFALGAGVSTADATVTLSPTLDNLKEQAKDISLDASYTLTKILTEGAAKVTINKETYYFTPSSNKDLLQTLAGTSAGIITSESGTPKLISFDVSKLPASVFSYTEGKIVLNMDKLSTSGGIAWSKHDSGSTTGNIKINLPNENNPTTLYYTVDDDSTLGTRLNDLISNVGNETKNVLFINSNQIDSSAAHGGAIHNSSDGGYSIHADFISNYTKSGNSTAQGGAVYNGVNVLISNITGDFIGNNASSREGYAQGGAVYNSKNGTIGTITGNFIDNYTTASKDFAKGGAIYNYYGTIGAIIGDFIENHASSGGAIYNDKGTIGNITGDFIGNYVSSSSSSPLQGGAVFNSERISNITGDFIGNHVSSSSSSALGGAVYNLSTIGNITGDFIGNSSSSSSSSALGGAVYNLNTIGNITGNFMGNHVSSSAVAQGGAIYNFGTITITGDSTFTDNYVEPNGGVGTSNAIHNLKIVNFDGTNIVVNDAITGNNNGTINIASSSNGMTTFNNSVSGNTVNLIKGTLKLGYYKSEKFGDSYGLFENSVNFVAQGGKLTTQDGETHEHNLGNLKLNADLNTSIDVDLSAKTGDVLTGSTAATATDGKQILIDNINVLADGTNHIVKVQVADANIKDVMDLANDVNIVMNPSDTNRYLVEYEPGATSGNLKFGNTQALETAVQFKKADKNFNITNVADIEVDLGKLVGPELTINGNNNVINGNNKKGMTIAGDQTLNLNDVTVKGFDGAFVNNAGTINLKSDTKSDIDSGISGNGTINVTGAGEVNINSNIEAKKMTVLGGELNLKSGSELENVENFVASDGVLNVGDQTISLKNATFNDGSTVAINIKSDGNGLLKADSLTVNGGRLKATLGQGIVEDGSKTVTLLESGTEFTNNFADVMENNMYIFEKADKAGDYIISLAKTAAEVSKENGGTQNNTGEAKAWVDGNKFEQGSVSAGIADKLADLAQNDGKKFNEALSALAPSDASLVRINSVNANTEMFRAVVSHLDDVSKKKQYGLSSGDVVDGVSVWAKAFGNHAKVDDTSKVYGFKSDGYGATLGIEKQLNDAFKVGLGYSYFYNDVDGFMRDSDVNTHTGFVYGEYRQNDWYTNAIASYGYSKYDENKHVAGDIYKAKYDVDNIGAQVMTGYNASVAKVDVTPEAGLRYNNIHRDNYVDSAGQAVKAETMDVMTAVAGLKVGKDLVSCFGVRSFYWRPEARLAATYDLISDKENAVVSLSNGSGYVVKGRRLNRFGIEAGADVTFYLSSDVESSVGYEGKFRKDYQDHTGYVSAKYKF